MKSVRTRSRKIIFPTANENSLKFKGDLPANAENKAFYQQKHFGSKIQLKNLIYR